MIRSRMDKDFMPTGANDCWRQRRTFRDGPQDVDELIVRQRLRDVAYV